MSTYKGEADGLQQQCYECPPSDVTPRPPENILRHVDLYLLTPGKVVEVQTRNSTYWLTVIEGRRVAQGRVGGISIVTTSETFGQTIRNPLDSICSRHVRVGGPIVVNSAETSPVRRVRVMN